MIWAFELLLQLWFGYSVVTYLIGGNLNILHRFFAGIPIGFFTFSWIVFLTTSNIPLTEVAALPANILLLISSIILTKLNSKQKLKKIVHLKSIQFNTYLVGGGFYVIVMYLSMLKDGTEVRGAAYGDLPFHLNIINSFALGANNDRKGLLRVRSLFYFNESLAYPYITNFHTAALMATGRASTTAALFFPSALMSLSLVIGIYMLSFIFCRDHFVCMLSLILFTNLGGLGFLKLLKPNHGYGDWEHDWGGGQYEYWFHPLFHVIVPQRASLWSMPLCYWCMMCIIFAINRKEYKPMILAAIYVAFMPLVQVHSYAAIAQWSICYAAVTFPWKKFKKWPKYVSLWAVFGIIANVFALPQLIPYTLRLSKGKSEFLQINPIWMEKWKTYGLRAPFICWWRGLGIFGAIALVFGWASITKNQIKIYMPSIIVWLIANIIRYQPWELDNTKIFYAGWIPVALPVVGQFLMSLFRKKRTFLISSILLFTACASGAKFTMQCLAGGPRLYEKKHIEFGQWIAENLPKDAVTVSTDAHYHPVSSLGGRMMFHGYTGWVSSHGYEWSNHDSERSRLTKSPESQDAYTKYGITYVLSMDDELTDFVPIKRNEYWTMIYDRDSNKIWRYIGNKNV